MTHDPHLGNIERQDGRTTLTFRRALAHQPEKVWRAITESEHMRWWMPVDMAGERFAGATLELTFWPDLVEKMSLDPAAGTASISVWEPHRVFEWIWHGSTIRFELTPTEDGCVLDLSVEIDTDEPDTIVDNAGGYHLWIEHLTRLLDHGQSPSIADAEPHDLESQYRSLLETH